jgi:hypothetical protein
MASAAYQRAWRKKHLMQVRAYRKKWMRKSVNKKKTNATSTLWRKRNPNKVRLQNRWSHYQVRYGLSKKEYFELRKKGCWLCGEPFRRKEIPDVDHDHLTDKFRGLAHALCNRAIGMVGDSSKMLYKIAKALEAYEKREKAKLQ